MKPAENTSPFAYMASAVNVSFFPNYTPDPFRNSIAVRACPVLPGLGRHSRKENLASRVHILCPKSWHELTFAVSFPYSIEASLDNNISYFAPIIGINQLSPGEDFLSPIGFHNNGMKVSLLFKLIFSRLHRCGKKKDLMGLVTGISMSFPEPSLPLSWTRVTKI